MKRLVWGIVLAVFGLLSVLGAGHNPQGPTGSIVVGILCLGGGAVLIFLGVHYIKDRDTVAEAALVMLRESGKIDGLVLAGQIGVREIKVRQLVADCQRRSILPFKADIV